MKSENAIHAQQYADAMWEHEAAYCRERDAARFEAIPESEKATFRAKLLEDATLTTEMIEQPGKIVDWHGRPSSFVQRVLQGALHPDNKATRKLFEGVSGLRLPPTVAGSIDVFADYFGRENWNAFHAELDRQQKAADAERAAQAERDRLEALAVIVSGFTLGHAVKGEDFLTLARSLDVPVPPQTAGVIRRRISSISKDGRVTGTGKTVPDGVKSVFWAVKAEMGLST